MPDGVMQWFDPRTGDARIVRGGHRYPSTEAEVEPSARRPGARVHFDIRREGGVERAVDVQLSTSAYTSRHRRRVGDLTGARRPDAKGAADVGLSHVEHGLALAGHPLAVAGAWARWMSEGDLEHALKLYAPDAIVHRDGTAFAGRSPLQGFLESSPVLGCGRTASVHGEGGSVRVRWGTVDPGVPALEVLCRVEHGQLVEQWFAAARPEPTASVERTATGELVIDVVTHGKVPKGAARYARERIVDLTEMVGDPILYARVKLDVAHNPARPRPVTAQATVDVNGHLIRAHVAADVVHEAVDLLQQRLRAKVGHLAEREKAERHLHEPATPGEWRRGDLPTPRPERFTLPDDERELVRHKAFIADELTEDEAAFDMDQLDYDFFLFRDLATGQDSVLARSPDGGITVGHAEAAPSLGVGEAIERLHAGGEDHVFFADAVTGRGAVVYRRFDGNDGLLTLEG